MPLLVLVFSFQLQYPVIYGICITYDCLWFQEDVIKPLLEVTKTALLHDCTLLCGWRYLFLNFWILRKDINQMCMNCSITYILCSNGTNATMYPYLCTLIVYNALISAPQVIVWRILHLNGFIMFYGSLIWLLYWVFTNLYINKIYVPPLAISVVDPFVTEVHLAFLVQLYLRWLS